VLVDRLCQLLDQALFLADVRRGRLRQLVADRARALERRLREVRAAAT